MTIAWTAKPWRDPGGWVFTSLNGSQPLGETVFNRGWQRIRRDFAKHGIRPLTLHSARHTWATLALRAGKSIRWIADQLGHSDPALTLRIYAHVLPDEGEDLGFLDFGPPDVLKQEHRTTTSQKEREE